LSQICDADRVPCGSRSRRDRPNSSQRASWTRSESGADLTSSEADLRSPVPHSAARRALLRCGATALALLLSSLGVPGRTAAQEARPTLFVFLQLDVKSSALEQALQKQIPGLALTVFGRFRDFQDGVATKNPDAVITITPLLDLDHTKAALQGMRGGKEWEPYLLVTAGAGTPPAWAGKTIGIVDLLGRDGTQAFAQAAVGSNEIKVKRVAKIEDLLPLLEFSAADAVLVPGSALKRLTERTRLPLTVRDLPGARVGLPALAIRNEKARAVIVQAIQKVDAETRSLIGIDTWSAR
jgi:hypothetical protein